MIRVLVADSSRIHTHLLADAMRRDPELEVVPFDSDSRALVAAVVSQDVHVLVLGFELDDEPPGGLAALRELHTIHPGTAVVVLLNSSKPDAVLNAFRAGARGVFNKSDPIELLCKCVRCVHQGQIWANSRELAVAIESLASAAAAPVVNAAAMTVLSKREVQVVRYLAEGLTNREIAERLKLSQHTVKNYLFRIFDKLGVSSRVELLFMTLNPPGAVPYGSGQHPPPQLGSTPRGSDEEFASFQKAAEAGSPAAQLALAQMYVMRRNSPQDVVLGYKWYLVAMEQALQITAEIKGSMTPEQIEEAQREAASWLSRPKPVAAEGAPQNSRPAPPLSPPMSAGSRER